MTTIRHVLLALVLFAASAAQAEVLLLKNDSYTDGGGFTCNQGIGPEYYIAAKFTAPPSAYPYTVDKILVFTCTQGVQGTFYVDIWQDNGTLSPGPLLWSSSNGYSIGGANAGFNIIDLSGEPIPPPTITTGTIRVGLYAAFFTVGPGFGIDTDGVVSQRNLVMLANGTWHFSESLAVAGDWIFRVEIQEVSTGVGDGPFSGFALEQNVPNPFNPITTIRYQVAVDGTEVNISIYDAEGRRVRTLVDERRPAGSGSAVWNGVDEHGARVASGVYFYRMQAGGYEQTRKMVMLK